MTQTTTFSALGFATPALADSAVGVQNGADVRFTFSSIMSLLGSGNIIIGTSLISGGTSGRVLYDNNGVQGEYPVTGTAGSVVLSISPALVTPDLGTPTALVLTNATGLPVASVTGMGTGVATFLATPTSANLLAAVTNETGTGALVFANTPTLVTPVLGDATATTIAINGAALTDAKCAVIGKIWGSAGVGTLTSTYFFFGSASDNGTTAIVQPATGVIGPSTDFSTVTGSFGTKTKAGAFVAGDFPAGSWYLGRDTSGATTKLYYNNAGALMAVALA